MNHVRNISLVIALGLLCGCSQSETKERPNILLIVADDLGYSDMSFYGSEISTPNLDELASNGLLLTNFYTAMTCSPTRSMLFSGTDNHLAGLGIMEGEPRDDQKGQPGYEAYLNFRVASLADLMTDAGYNTYMSGKWHLGVSAETSPNARGMKRSFALLEGGAAHLGGLSLVGPDIAKYQQGSDQALYQDGAAMTSVKKDFYSTRDYTERMIEFIESDRADEKPFFAYLAYTAPHWPLQAPDESIKKFEGLYDDGYSALYRSRYDRMQQLGVLPDNALPFNAGVLQQAWDELSPDKKLIESRKMEIYAAMVSDMDIYVGRLIEYLKSINEFENTFIMFMSDNGAENLARENLTIFKDWAAFCCDNSYANMGKENSYVTQGENWASVSAAPFQGFKSTGFEGGIHVPAFVHYEGLNSSVDRNNAFATVMDLLPTFLDLAQTEHPGNTYRGLSVLPVKGKSLLPTLTEQEEFIHGEDEFIGWELYGHRSIRQGDWKIVWDANKGSSAEWELYNIKNDPSEQENLARANVSIMSKMIMLWERYENDNGVIY